MAAVCVRPAQAQTMAGRPSGQLPSFFSTGTLSSGCGVGERSRASRFGVLDRDRGERVERAGATVTTVLVVEVVAVVAASLAAPALSVCWMRRQILSNESRPM